jgi:glycosidase
LKKALVLLDPRLSVALLSALVLALPGVGGCGGADSCAGVDCGAHGACVVDQGLVACLCDPGHVADGLTCVVDPCTPSPCVHGTCAAAGGTAVCTCEAGYADATCSTCAPGYHVDGLRCVTGSACAADPCVYGTCRAIGGEASCECSVGYSGALCDECATGYFPRDLECVRQTSCDPDPCVHGVCSDASGVAVCTCDSGYTGAHCGDCAPGYHESGLTCVPDLGGPCDPNPCTTANRQVCQVDGTGYLCGCNPGFHDDNGACVADTVCAPNPCTQANRHVCVAEGSTYVCRCDAGYHDEGGSCVADTVCTPNPCTVVGRTTCVPDGGGYRCDCDGGYHLEGATCVANTPCSPNPCVAPHQTRCTIDGSSYLCGCDPGYHDDTGTCVADTVCDPATTCSGHGTCTGVGLTCQCSAGYAGDHCEACATGYHPAGDGCVLDSPCDPNPCVTVGKTVCTPSGASYVCSCSPGYQDSDHDGSCLPDCNTAGLSCGGHGHCALVAGAATCVCDTGYTGPSCADCATGYQDNDHDSTCQPTCANAGLSCGALTCSDASGMAICVGTRTCASTVTYDPAGQTITALYVRGEFNSWGLSTPMTLGGDGAWHASLTLAAGDYAYKLYDQGRDLWFEDPGNPYFKWVSNQRNSRLRVPDCNQPLLVLLGAPTVASGSVAFQVQYVDGAAGAGVDPTSATVTRNGTTVAGAFNADTGVFTIADTGLAAGKYAYYVTARDLAGRAAARLYVPVWIESSPFAWQDAVMYFAMTDRFKDGDAGNNAPVAGVDPKANWQGGDFAGLKGTVDSGYFDTLGVNALWISSPIENTAGGWMGSGGDTHLYSGYHSYWPIATGWRPDHQLPGVTLIDPHFGTLDDLKALVRAAHAHGIRVLVDVVGNHVHQESPLWSQYQSASPPWFNLPTYVCGWDQPLTCWFASYLPDFHFETLPALDAVVEHFVWLAQEADLDGFRVDAVKHFIHDLGYALRGRIQESVATTGTRFYMVGETFTGESDGEKQLIKSYVHPEELDGQFDFPLYWQVVKTFLREEQDYRPLESMLQANEGYYGSFAVMSNFLGNHDVPRALSHAAGQIADMWGNGAKDQGWNNPPPLPTTAEPYQRLRLAWTFLLTIRGIPLIYYGDEFGMEGAGDPDNRKMMRFGTSLIQLQSDTRDHVAKLTAARRAHPAFRYGTRTQLYMDQSNGLFWAYGAKQGSDVGVVVFNRNGSSQTRTIPVASLGLTNGQTLRDVIHGTTLTVSGGNVSVTLGARDSAVLVLP